MESSKANNKCKDDEVIGGLTVSERELLEKKQSQELIASLPQSITNPMTSPPIKQEEEKKEEITDIIKEAKKEEVPDDSTLSATDDEPKIKKIKKEGGEFSPVVEVSNVEQQKVLPIKIVLQSSNPDQDSASVQQPYIISSESPKNDKDTEVEIKVEDAAMIEKKEDSPPLVEEEPKIEEIPTVIKKEVVDEVKERDKPTRVTRSSHRIAHSSPSSPKNNSPSPSQAESSVEATPQAPAPDKIEKEKKVEKDKTEKSESGEIHPRKRKIKTNNSSKDKEKEPSCSGISSSSSSTSGEPNILAESSTLLTETQNPVLNCYEMYFNIRKQIERRRENLFPVQPKPPQGFKDYLMNRGTYVLASTPNAHLVVPNNPVPSSFPPTLKELFLEQEKERIRLRLQQVVEKEKLVLAVEQEILRVHGRAARALSNQALPFSVCTFLKDEEVYNLLTPEQEEKDRNARSRYNGRLFLSWLQDVDDKWEKIKESMVLRHHNEAESLYAVQKMDWEWKLKEVGLCEPKSTPVIDELSVPMVHVSDEFDLLPS